MAFSPNDQNAELGRLYVTRIRGRKPWYCCLRCPSQVQSEGVMQKHVEIHRPQHSKAALELARQIIAAGGKSASTPEVRAVVDKYVADLDRQIALIDGEVR